MDRRLTPANARIAALSLAGQVEAPRYVVGEARRLAVPVANLCRDAGGARDRQLLFGADVTLFEDRAGWAFVQAVRDGYVGYVESSALAPARAATHRVVTHATHLYRDEDFRSPDLMHLSFGAIVTVTDERLRFLETPEGFVPKTHLRPLDRPFADPATVAQLHFGVPYLWGGNSVLGIDCSGLVQAAHLACDVACPGDSDMQAAALGADLPADAPLRRGDIIFWRGHVGLMVDEVTLLHANAHHMAVAYESFDKACLRIAAQNEHGQVIARKRL